MSPGRASPNGNIISSEEYWGSRLDLRHNGSRSSGQIAQVSVPLQTAQPTPAVSIPGDYSEVWPSTPVSGAAHTPPNLTSHIQTPMPISRRSEDLESITHFPNRFAPPSRNPPAGRCRSPALDRPTHTSLSHKPSFAENSLNEARSSAPDFGKRSAAGSRDVEDDRFGLAGKFDRDG